MKNSIFIALFLLSSLVLSAQNNTDVSLFLRSDSSTYLNEIRSESGDLYTKLGHHGPAIENEWLALRLYFDKKAAIDVYSKSKPGLELADAQWYPSPEEQKSGWGADYYKVGSTVGLGGVRLWDGEKIVPLHPVSERIGRVKKEHNQSYMEMLSKDVPYKNTQVDILVRVTVFSGEREAKVEAFALSDEEVQFVTGINYHEGQKVAEENNFILAWGLHPEDVALESIEIGAAILFDPELFSDTKDDGNQKILISKPTKQLNFHVTSANEKEPDLNSFENFNNYLKDFK